MFLAEGWHRPDPWPMEMSPVLVVKPGRAHHFSSPWPQPCPTAAPLPAVPAPRYLHTAGAFIPPCPRPSLRYASGRPQSPGAALVAGSLQVLPPSLVVPILPVLPIASARFPVLPAPRCRCPSIGAPAAPLNFLLMAQICPGVSRGAPPGPHQCSLVTSLVRSQAPHCCSPRIPRESPPVPPSTPRGSPPAIAPPGGHLRISPREWPLGTSWVPPWGPWCP